MYDLNKEAGPKPTEINSIYGNSEKNPCRKIIYFVTVLRSTKQSFHSFSKILVERFLEYHFWWFVLIMLGPTGTSATFISIGSCANCFNQNPSPGCPSTQLVLHPRPPLRYLYKWVAHAARREDWWWHQPPAGICSGWSLILDGFFLFCFVLFKKKREREKECVCVWERGREREILQKVRE